MGFPGVSDGKEATCNAGDLGWKDPLEKGMATHSSILAWRIPWTEEPGGLQSPGWGHANPLQYSFLENPMERETWQATVCRVAKSQTWLRQLSTHTHNIACIFRSTVQNKKDLTLGFYVWSPIAWLTWRKSKSLEYRDLGPKPTLVTC